MPQDRPPVRISTPVPERQSGEHPRQSGIQFDGEETDLTVEQQQRISTLFSRLAEADPYELLDVPRAADKKAIKRAYNARVVDFHPDRFFRKRLGTFKAKMEAIIARMTEAQELLCDAERRAAYDATLQENRRSRIDDMLEEAMKEIEVEGSSRYEVFEIQNAVEVHSAPPAPPKPGPPKLSVTPQEITERRQLLARRLSGRPPPPKPGPPKK